MLRVEIIKQDAGYTTPAYSWDCAMCEVSEPLNLSRRYVEVEAEKHLRMHHSVRATHLNFYLVDRDKPDAFTRNTQDRLTLREKIKAVVILAADSAYGTDPRHHILGKAVADEVAFGIAIPWGFGKQFGRS